MILKSIERIKYFFHISLPVSRPQVSQIANQIFFGSLPGQAQGNLTLLLLIIFNGVFKYVQEDCSYFLRSPAIK